MAEQKVRKSDEAAEGAVVHPFPVPPLPDADRLDLSVIVVTWNSERWIDRCLQSLPAACAGLTYEILVYDNASSDATVSHVGKSAIVMRSQSNEGFGAATNRAFSASRGRYVFLLNPDCELDPGALTTLCRFLDENAIAAAVAPLLTDEAGDSQREFQLRRLPTLRAFAAEALLIDKLLPANRVTARHRYRDLDLSKPQHVEQPAAAALLIRREVFEEIGPFDEQFWPAWFEDVDYCRRLAQAGRDIFIVPEANARHFGGASLEYMPYADFIDTWYRNMWRYARKWFSPGRAEALRWAIIVGMMMRVVAAMAGLRNGTSSRREALAAYRMVLKKALNRWDGSSPSSS